MHDFNLSFLKTFADEEKMVTFSRAVDQFELIHLDLSLAWLEVV
jgi:hypothetical protein